MNRSKEVQEELKSKIRDLYIFFHKSARTIEAEVNEDPDFVKRFGKVPASTVQRYINKIKAEYEHYIGEDAIDKYTAEFVRLQNSMDQELDDIDNMIKETDNKELKIRLMRLRHEIRLDKMRMLQDIELPLAVKKLKLERSKKLNTIKMINEEPTENLGGLDA